MAWQEPKTDWKASDYVNIEDYNRWIGNIAHIKGMALEVYRPFELGDMGKEKTYSDYIYADEINQVEENLTLICRNTYPFVIGEQKTYYPNQPTMDYEEINRIESACLLMYHNLSGQISGRTRLSFRLGGDKF